MHGIYNYIPATNQCCNCSVFTVCATCNVISPVKYVLYFYISTSRSMCAVPNMAVVRNSLTSCLGIFWIILRWYQSPLLLLVSRVFLHATCAEFLLHGLFHGRFLVHVSIPWYLRAMFFSHYHGLWFMVIVRDVSVIDKMFNLIT
jgi:hypothetical protein